MFTQLVYIAELLIAVLFMFGFYRMITAIREESRMMSYVPDDQSSGNDTEGQLTAHPKHQTRQTQTLTDNKPRERQPVSSCKKQILNDYIGDFF